VDPVGAEREWARARAPLWDELAALLGRARRPRRLSGDELRTLAQRYQQAAADLAYLRQQQPGSVLVPRLNDLVARGHAVLYRREQAGLRALARFLWTGYPALVCSLVRPIAVAIAVQLVVVLPAAVWALHDPVSAAATLPAGLREVPRHHDPVPAAASAPLSTFIWTHNIIVSFVDFAGGALLGLGTLWSLYVNSLLLGVLSGVTNHGGIDAEYWSLILPHAVLELSAFTICAGAGLALADAIVRARPRQRLEVIAETARRGGLVVLGTMPVLILAGTIEGFVTPSAAPIAAKLAVAPVTGVFLAAYLVRGRAASHGEDRPHG
jgi:uncharacterized membrane protein SpoIIM required for sporulation